MKKIILAAVAAFTLFNAGVAQAAGSVCEFVNYNGYLIPLPSLSKSALTAMLTREGFTPAAIQLIINAIPKCAIKQ